MRSGIQIWLEKERTDNLLALLSNSQESKFIDLENQLINTADISGIFTSEIMDEYTRRKNGQWKCSLDEWHDKGEKCDGRWNLPEYAKRWKKGE